MSVFENIESAGAELSQTAVMELTTGNVWMMLCIALVFIMHLGFACVEAGFTQSKNTVNILFKNTLTPAIGLVSYTIIGFNLMYPEFAAGPGWFDFSGFFIEDKLGLNYNPSFTYWTSFLFQAMFAATAATIVSGAVAERIKISAYLIFTILFVGFIYPLIGSWTWGGGALAALGFYDFAGSTLVHAVGGWGALAGVIVLGPRIGKYLNGRVVDKPGSSVPLATIGVFLLWFGWFGFNGGSVLSANPLTTSLVLVNTSLAAASGALGGFLMGYIAFKRMDLGMVLNGVLAGLVGITAGADLMSPGIALLIGFIAGLLVVLSALFLDRLKLDDAVGAISVHLTCGIWGTLAVGIFGQKAGWDQLLNQIIGIAVCGGAAFGAAFLIFYLMNKVAGIRVSADHEVQGLDSHEHGIRGYTITHE